MSTEPTLTLGTYKPTDADFNGCHAQAIAALVHLANHPRPTGGNDHFNTEHLLQIAAELKRSLAAIQKAATLPAQEPSAARLKELEALWPDTLAAFRGAFDTPVARRHDNSEYAEDARDRMRTFAQAMTPEPAATPEELARIETEGLNKLTYLEEALDRLVHGPRPSSPGAPR